MDIMGGRVVSQLLRKVGVVDTPRVSMAPISIDFVISGR